MNLALLVHSSLTALGKQLQRKRPVAIAAVSHSRLPAMEAKGKPRSMRPEAAAHRAPYTGAARPLRVLRVIEHGNTHVGSERLVMSGRMADVCAELDRLVALEATAH
jgi:hypothetical protein